MLYGELGVYKIDITVKCRMISFWLKLATDDNENKFVVKMFYYLSIIILFIYMMKVLFISNGMYLLKNSWWLWIFSFLV